MISPEVLNLTVAESSNGVYLGYFKLEMCLLGLLKKNHDSDSSAVFWHLSGIGSGIGIVKEFEDESFSNS